MVVDTASAPHFKSNYVLGEWVKIYKPKFRHQALKILDEDSIDSFHILWSLCIYRHVLVKRTLQIPHWPLLLSNSPAKQITSCRDISWLFFQFLNPCPVTEPSDRGNLSAVTERGYICTLYIDFVVYLLKGGKNQRKTFDLKKKPTHTICYFDSNYIQIPVIKVSPYQYITNWIKLNYIKPTYICESVHRGIKFVIKKIKHKILYRRFSFHVLIHVI